MAGVTGAMREFWKKAKGKVRHGNYVKVLLGIYMGYTIQAS